MEKLTPGKKGDRLGSKNANKKGSKTFIHLKKNRKGAIEDNFIKGEEKASKKGVFFRNRKATLSPMEKKSITVKGERGGRLKKCVS